MQIEPAASHAGLPVASARPMKASASDQAAERGDVLGEDDEQLAVARAAEPAPEALPPRSLFTSRRHPQSETLSAAMPKTRMPIATQAFSSGSARLQLVDAFVDREQAAHAEQHQRDDEAPEVDRLAVAERMVAARLGACPRAFPRAAAPGWRSRRYEWIASASIDDEPVKTAPAVLASAIRKFAPSANRIDLSESAPADIARLSSGSENEGTPKASAPPARREGSEAGRVQSCQPKAEPVSRRFTP